MRPRRPLNTALLTLLLAHSGWSCDLDWELPTTETVCVDGTDDEGDGFIDCQDLDCELDPACSGEGLSCQVLSFCYFCCQKGDQDCFAACDNIAATPAAKAQMYVLLECATANCGPDCTPVWDCFECVRRQCPAAVENCGLHTRGENDCLMTFGCSLSCSVPVHTGTAALCPNDDGIWCVENCFRGGRPEIQPIARSLLYCVLENCYTECYEEYNSSDCNLCSTNYCAWEYNRCLSDA